MTARLGIALATALLAAACAQAARELPPDVSRLAAEERLKPGDRDDPAFALECAALNRTIAGVKSERAQHEAKIAKARLRDQLAVFLFAPLALPLAPLLDPNRGEKGTIRTLDERADRLDRIRAAKRCGPN